MLRIKRIGLKIYPQNDMETAEGSYDVPVELINDDSYSNAKITMFVGYRHNGVEKSFYSEKNDDGKYLIHGCAFAQNGNVSISFLIEDDGSGLMTHAVEYTVTKTPGGADTLPAKYIWEPVVKSFVDDYLATEQIQNQIIEYLIKNGKVVQVDNTLTLQGYAADSKAVGDKFTEIVNKLNKKITIDQLSDELKKKLEETDLTSLKLSTKEENGKTYLVISDDAGEISSTEISSSGGLSFNSGYVTEDGYLHLTKDGEDIEGFDPFFVGTGTGGGASGSRLVLAMSTSSAFSVLENSQTAEIKGRFASTDTETGVATGNGNLAIYVNGVLKENRSIEQGDFTIDVRKYLSNGANTVKLVVTDSYGASATRTTSITVDSFKLGWNLEKTVKNSGTLVVYVTPTGSGEKTIYLMVDGVEYDKTTVTTTGRRITFNVELDEGAHIVSTYGEMTSDGMTLTSDKLTCAVAQVDEDSDEVVIAALFPEGEIAQYTTISIPYRVIDPNNNPAAVKFLVNGSEYFSSNMDQSEHEWAYRPSVTGKLTLGIMCGTKLVSKELMVTGLSSDITEVTDNLVLKIEPSSMTEIENFVYNGTTIALSNKFDKVNGGLTTDNEGTRCIKVMKGDRLTINHNLFGTDARKNGMNFKIIYKIENSSKFDAEAISCYSGSIGMRINANNALIKSEQASVNLQTCEGYKTEFECNIEADSDNRLLQIWEKGTPAATAIYATNDNFAQISPVGITVGSDDCNVLLYLVRVYTRDLTKEEIKANYCADGKDATEIMKRHDRNQIYDSTGKLDVDLVAQKNPDLHVLVWHAPNISTSKENKIVGTLTHQFVNGGAGHKWTANNVNQKAQGTSSLGYVDAGCNEDFECAEGFILEDGTNVPTYAMTAQSIGVNYFNYKTNVASEEHINNIMVNNHHNKYQPFIREARLANPKVRDTVEGHLAVLFFHNTSDEVVQVGPYSVLPDETIFYSLGCMNNSKKNAEVFAYDDIVVEVGNNISAQCRFKSDDLSAETWDGKTNFEFRYRSNNVTEEFAKAKWQELMTFVVSCNADDAPNTAFATVQTINGQTFAIDSPAYRKAKWKAYAKDYFEMESLFYHQVITLVFSQVDNRSKNTFFAYNSKTGKWHIVFAYDNDTCMGNDNEGGLTLKYGYLDTDTIGTRDVFNAADNTIFLMNRYCFAEELLAMYIDRENAGAWDLDKFADTCDVEQEKACESLWIEDAWRKNIDTYINLGTSAYIPMQHGKKRLQRKQFLTFQRAFMSSYFVGAFATDDSATIRGYTPSSYKGVAPKSEMTIIPYCDLFVTVKAASTTIQERALAGEAVTINLGESNMNDTEIYVRNASFIQDLGDMACLYPGYIDIANCRRLKRANVGSSVDGYNNTNMKEITIKNAVSLEYLNLENCPELVQELDASNNINLKECYTRGSGLTGITFANYGRLRIALMNALSGIYGHNLQMVETFTMEDYSNLTTINIEGSPSIDSLTLVMNAINLARVRLIDVLWNTTVKAYDVLMHIHNISGIDDDGHNTSNGVITGDVHFNSISETKYNTLVETIPTVNFTYGERLEEVTATFVNDDGTVLYVAKTEKGGSIQDPVAAGLIETPTKESTIEYTYTYYKWDTALDAILQDVTIKATYLQSIRTYTVKYVDYDGSILQEYTGVSAYGSCSYTGPELSRAGYVWTGWDKIADNVTEDMVINAVYAYPTLPSEVKDVSKYDYACSDDPNDTSAYTFGELYSIIKMGRTAEYLPEYSKVKMVLSTDVVTDTSLVFDLHSIGHYALADGSGMSKADFYMVGVLAAGRRMNPTNSNIGGWDESEMREWLNETLYPALPCHWRQLMAPSITLASKGGQSATIVESTDYLRLISHAELGFDVAAVPYKNEISTDAAEVTFSKYTDNNSKIKKTFNGEGAAQAYWTRSADASSSSAFRTVANGGYALSNGATNSHFVCAGFSC